jgi:tripartite-type tricarboxylate transporter receptor subunit TctC
MKLARRNFLHLAAGAAALPAVSCAAIAQTYPARPITLIVPFPGGGPADAVGRLLAERMRGSLGQPIIIEDIGGAEGSIATGRAARVKPDGYTIILGYTATHVLNAALYSLPYDVLNDFAPVSPVVSNSQVLFAAKKMPANDTGELIAWLRSNKASAGIGSSTARLIATFFQKETDTQFTLVPYRTANTAMQDLVAGQIELVFTTPDRLRLMQAGSIKAYAVTSDGRLPMAPDMPTFAEIGLPALSFSGWYGIFAPKGTPGDIIGRLHRTVVEAMDDPALRAPLVDLGFEVFPRERQTPEVLSTLQKADIEKWWPIIKAANIKGE